MFNLGCKVNQYESDRIAAELKAAGFCVSDRFDFADLYVLNTCAVTAEAERKSRQAVARAKKHNKDGAVIVCGCASEKDSGQFVLKDGVMYVSGVAGKSKIAQTALDIIKSKDKEAKNEVLPLPSIFEEGALPESPRTRAYIKIQDGCNNFCSYCIVPYLRGRSRSRSIESIKKEADALPSDIKEVVLIGINLSAFGADTGTSLAELLGVFAGYNFRLRLGSLEVNVITEDFLEAAKALENFCPHFHLSLQSGCEATLKAMNRHYTPEEYAKKVALIRDYFEDAAITTDIIAGFPTENDEQFWESYEFAKRIGFADMHCFPYSSRKGTKAGELPPLKKEVVERRAFLLGELAKQLKAEFLHQSIGKEAEVLFEEEEDGILAGYSKNYIKVYSGDAKNNEIRKVVLKKLFKDGLK